MVQKIHFKFDVKHTIKSNRPTNYNKPLKSKVDDCICWKHFCHHLKVIFGNVFSMLQMVEVPIASSHLFYKPLLLLMLLPILSSLLHKLDPSWSRTLAMKCKHSSSTNSSLIYFHFFGSEWQHAALLLYQQKICFCWNLFLLVNWWTRWQSLFSLK